MGDPFRLERLAEELDERELEVNIDHQLPDYVPLSHDNPYLVAGSFDVQVFLLSREHTSLTDLRIELRDYLSTLKEELVKLINDDYEAFISLSTDLRGEGVRLDRIKYPLSGLKWEIENSKQELSVLQSAIEKKLQLRAIFREEKALVNLLLKISDSLTRLESLLLIASASQDAPESDTGELNSLKPDEIIDEKSRGNHAKHLSRVAAEYTQLLYHASKARGEKCVFVDEIQWRIDRIQSTLSSDLDQLLATTLRALTADSRAADAERKHMSDLTECLRTYDVLSLWSDAEDVLRREVIRGFVKKTIFSGSLAAPHSPILPHTPFHSSSTTGFPSSNSLIPPRTPYTPFTSFPLKTPFLASHATTTSPFSRFLDESDEPLAKLYSQILRFVERDLSRIMDVAEKVSVRSLPSLQGERSQTSTPLHKLSSQAISRPDKEGFNIMSNVVWDELGKAIMDHLGGIIFASGRPDEFRKNHEITMAFIRSLEFLAPSAHAVETMRSHPVYAAFNKRWQLPVYFQLRWKEIVGRFEDALVVTRIDIRQQSPFVTTQTTAVWTAISACWSAEIFIPELGARFWKLTLQLLSRYKTWLEQSIHAAETSSKTQSMGAVSNDNRSPTRTPTPSAESQTPESSAADDALLRQYAAAIVDTNALSASVLTIWQEEISMMLPDASDFPDLANSAEDALKHSLSTITSVTAPLSTHIVAILTKKSCDALTPVRSIPSQFRAMSNKRLPTEPSYFVTSILRPIKVFFGIGVGQGSGQALKEAYLSMYAEDIFETVSQRYMNYIATMRKTEESLRRLKKGKKATFSLFGNAATAKDDEGQDEDRIRQQMILDVDAFGKDAESLGINLQKNRTFQSLYVMVRAAEA